MRWIDFAELDARAADFDACVAASPEIDRFCSSTDWILPARAAFAPEAQPFILAAEGGYVALMAQTLESRVRAAFPLEASWGLASPFAGADPVGLVNQLFAALPEAPRPPPQFLVLSGVRRGGRAHAALARRRPRTLRAGPPTLRIAADLRGGLDGFLSRRSPKFRAAARRARRAAAASGVTYERHLRLDPPALARVWERILAVERRCWKSGAALGGIDRGPMRDFYAAMLPRLARRDALRVVFAVRDGRDLAYCFGGLFGREYRGLQASFDDEFARESPGVLVHLEMIELLCAEGALSYDLGSDMEYKRRWGEPGLETMACVVALAGP